MQNLVEIDSAVMNLRMRKKTRIRVDFLLTSERSVSEYEDVSVT